MFTSGACMAPAGEKETRYGVREVVSDGVEGDGLLVGLVIGM